MSDISGVEVKALSVKSSQVEKTKSFTANLSGLDCPDCLGKVRHAVKRLDGVEVEKLDFVQGIARLTLHDCTSHYAIS